MFLLNNTQSYINKNQQWLKSLLVLASHTGTHEQSQLIVTYKLLIDTLLAPAVVNKK